MAFNHQCKGCTGGVSISSDPVIYYSDPLLEDSSEFVNENVLKERLDLCLNCTSLQYGTTCMHSGALVSFRAKLKNKGCPFPGSPKWESIV
ncbi:hypothetical protein [Bacillus solitudinis]|uniref:hypothetical protein n=1 Tax=Bacillus solitudinis TaxID=2014074 RepID=UPI000C248221|nr:hypothetical protein [Bacillus solitudinis]